MKNAPFSSNRPLAKAFSLVEIMTVIAVLTILLALTSGAFRSLMEGSSMDRAIIGISSALELARQKAVARGTYTWVAMSSDEDGDAGQNVVTVATFESADGTRGQNLNEPGSIRLLSKVEQYEGVALLEGLPAGNRVGVPRVSSARSPTQSAFVPKTNLPSHVRDVQFDWVVLFTPRGEATIDASPASGQSGADGDSIDLIDAIDFAVISRKGASSSDLEQKSAAALRVNGFTGQVSIFQPEAGQ